MSDKDIIDRWMRARAEWAATTPEESKPYFSGCGCLFLLFCLGVVILVFGA